MSSITHRDVCKLLGLPAADAAEDSREFVRVSGFGDARADCVVFAQDPASLGAALASGAGLILALNGMGHDANGKSDARVLRVTNPKLAFALVGTRLAGSVETCIHPSAVIEGEVGAGTSVGAGSVIEAGAVVGRDCRIGVRVTILKGTSLGDRCVVQPGAVLGSTGFGYAQGPDGCARCCFRRLGRCGLRTTWRLARIRRSTGGRWARR